MRLHEYTDESGFKQCVLLREGDRVGEGIACDVPEFKFECKDLRRDIHNELISRRLFSWADVQINQGVLTGVAKKIGFEHKLDKNRISSLRRELIYAYKQRR